MQLLVGKKKTQIEFLHTFSALVESGRQIVIASDVSPKALKELDAGLVTRFLSGLVVGMRKPDFATRLGIARTQARRLRSQLDERVLEYVAESVRGNARELLGALMKLDIHAQLSGGGLSLDEAREVLTEFVAAHFGLLPEDLLGGSRKRRVAHVRQLAMFLARRHTAHSLAEIGKYFGRRNHTTVRCAEVKIARLLEGKDEALMRDMRAILEQLED